MTERDERQPNSRARRIASEYLIAAAIFYEELVFKLSTTIRPLGWNLAAILLDSAALGLLVWLLSAVMKTPKARRAVTLAALVLLPLIFCVEYFIYRQFKVFYDLNTVFNGAGHAVTGFAADIRALVFCFNGLSHIFLFFLPALLYGIFGRRFDDCAPLPRERRLAAAQAAALFALKLLLVLAVPTYAGTYGKQYNFQNAVDTFGLLSAVRLDVRSGVLASDEVEFAPAEPEPVSEPEPEPEPAAETPGPVTAEDAGEAEPVPEPEEEAIPPVEYNALDIDFAALAASAGGTEAKLDAYVATLAPSNKNAYTGLFAGKNLIMITAEAFSAEVIDPELTPTLYRLATKGINFTDYTQSATAGTTGGEFSFIFGMWPTDGGRSMRDTMRFHNYYTMGSQLDRLGYFGKMYHNNTYTYYNRHKTHVNLGYSEGYMGYGNGMEAYVTSQWPQSDLEMIQGTLAEYIDQPQFNIYYMTVSGHGGYSRAGNAMSKKHWEQVKDLPYRSEAVKAYIACNLELEDALTYLVDALEEKGIADDTVICLTADHFPYGLDSGGSLGNMPLLSELYGYPVNNYLERDHNRLILWCGSLEDEEPIVVNDPVSCVDVLPTLSNLFGLEFDSRLLPGRDVFSDSAPLVWTMFRDWKTDLGTYLYSRNRFTPASEDVEIPEGYVEAINAVVSNKITYCKGFLKCDYLAHVLGTERE